MNFKHSLKIKNNWPGSLRLREMVRHSLTTKMVISDFLADFIILNKFHITNIFYKY